MKARLPLFTAGLLILLPTSAAAQDTPDFGKLVDFISWGGVAMSSVVVVVAMILIRVVREVSARFGARFTSKRLLVQKVESFVRFLVYVGAASACIGLSVQLDPPALAVIGGALAFAVGFAMRDLVAAFIAGITIMFDRPFQVGDRVEYAGQYGDIIEIGLRSVRMNTLDHNVVTIPNNKVLTDVTSCGNYGALEMQVPMDFYVGIDQDGRFAIDLVREACLTSRYVFMDRDVPVLARQVLLQDAVALHIKARPYVLDTRYEKAFETDVHLRVLDAFRRHGISPPAALYRNASDGAPEPTGRIRAVPSSS